jgi:stage II sporulation protein D
MFFVILAAVAGAWLAGCSSAGKPQPTVTEHGPVIRALVGEEPGSFVVESKGGFRIESEGGIVLMRSNDPSSVTIAWRDGSTQLRLDPQGTVAVAEGNIFITPFRSSNLRYGGVAYAGRILVRVENIGPTFRVINVLPLETYLEGVLPHEMGDPGPDAFAAMEAQAITARTYALSRIETRREEPFDVYASVRDQVYRGRERVSRLASGAVRETSGIVLRHKKELARTYYCATCGGHTSDIRRVWPQRDPARYLYGVLDRDPDEGGSFCRWVHNYRWRYSFSGKDLGQILRRTIPAQLRVDPDRVGSLIDAGISERSPSGRVRRVEITTTEGSFTLEGDRIRWVLMPDPDAGRILPSTMFNIYTEKLNGRISYISIVGGGNGHGVGMCQNGAIEMAKRGYTRDMILSHYYPGTKVAEGYGSK